MKNLILFLCLSLVLFMASHAGAQEIKGESYFEVHIFHVNAEIGDTYEISAKLLDAGANIAKVYDSTIVVYVLLEPSSKDVFRKVEQAIKAYRSP